MHASKTLLRASSHAHTSARLLSAPPCPRRSLAPLPLQGVVAYSSKQDEPSWGDIARQAGELGKATFNKIKNAATSLIAPKQQQQQQPQQPEAPPRPPPQDTYYGPQQRLRPRERTGLARPTSLGADDLLPGLFGRAAGSLLGGAFDMIGTEMAKSSKDRESVLEEATRRITASPAIKNRMGNVQVLPPTSQSSSTTSINGRSTQRISLVTPVQGSNGQFAYGQVDFVSDAGKRSSCMINVRMPEGDTVKVDEVDASGQTIDVDFREIS